MAIQFECPHCQAVVRCGLEAVGKVAHCPKCHGKVQVPEPSPSEADASVADALGEPSVPLSFDEIAAAVVPPALPDAAALPETEAPDSRTSVSRQVRRRHRRRRRGVNGIVPIALALLLVGGVTWYFWQLQGRIEGTLPAFVTADETLPQAVLPRSQVQVEDAVVENVLSNLKEHPYALTSEIMRVIFKAESRGLAVELEAGPQVDLYHVDFRPNSAYANWVRRNNTQLSRQHEAAVRAASAAFVNDWNAILEGSAGGEVMVPYRDAFGLLLLAGPVGSRLVAEYRGMEYPCVYQDAELRFYFLLPAGVLDFAIKGRDMPRGQSEFPGRFTIEVQRDAEPLPSSPETSPVDAETEQAPDADATQPDAKAPPSDADMKAPGEAKMMSPKILESP